MVSDIPNANPNASGEIVYPEFSLDRAENPHPDMLTRALVLRRTAKATPDGIMGAFWLGYRDAMCDATGETPDAIEAWMDRHDFVDIEGIVQARASRPLGIRRRSAR